MLRVSMLDETEGEALARWGLNSRRLGAASCLGTSTGTVASQGCSWNHCCFFLGTQIRSRLQIFPEKKKSCNHQMLGLHLLIITVLCFISYCVDLNKI